MQIHEEQQYLDILSQIIEKGQIRENRTGTPTRRILGAEMRFDISKNFILLTTKEVFLRGIFEELKFFLSGNTNSKVLEGKKIKIWQGNTTREFLDKKKLAFLPEGEMGCTYPHQWRNFGGEHSLIPETQGCKGIDQIQKIINLIRTNPTSRRIYLVGSNPAQEHLMCLPPCHCYAQFDCDVENKLLNCFVLIRSNDMFLGNPFNLAQYNLLTVLLAKITGYKPGQLIYYGVDVHLYENHIEQAKLQITREPRPFPQLKIHKKLSSLTDVLKLEFSDLELVNYNPYPRIKAGMAV